MHYSVIKPIDIVYENKLKILFLHINNRIKKIFVHEFLYVQVKCNNIITIIFGFRQTEEMRLAVETLETGSTEKSISEMAGRHFEEMSLLQGHWGSRVDALKLEQRRQYRNWIMRLLEEQQTSMLSTPVYDFYTVFPPDFKESLLN